MSRLARLAALKGDCRGATLVEFALLAPVFIVLMFGVLQVGIALQSYNAMRSMSADVARHAMVEKAAGRINNVTTAALKTYAESLGSGPPYMLNNDLDVTVTPVATPRVTGITEMTLTVEYTVPSILDPMGLKGPTLEFERPIFIMT